MTDVAYVARIAHRMGHIVDPVGALITRTIDGAYLLSLNHDGLEFNLDDLRELRAALTVELETRAGEDSTLRARIQTLITNHTSATGEHPVPVADLHNVLEPGSRRMRPARSGYAADCGSCWPEGSPS